MITRGLISGYVNCILKDAWRGHPLLVAAKSGTARSPAGGVGSLLEPTKSISAFYDCRSRIAVLDGNKVDHPDRPETTEGHHADHKTDDIGPDQRGEDEDQRAA